MKITIDTSKITGEDIGLFLSRYEVKDPVVEPENPEPEPEDPQPQVDHVLDFVDAYYKASGVVEVEGVSIGINPEKGDRHMLYVGLEKPTIARPYLLNGELIFTNQPNANFKTLTRLNSNPFSFPEEQTIVFRKMPGTDYEAISSGWGNYYLGFSSDNIRAGNSNAYLKAKAFPNYFELSFIHARYEADGITIWLNGKNVGKVATSDISRRLGYGVGIETNSTDFNWLATMYIERGMTDTEREQYFKTISVTYDIGSMPALPYASDIKIINSGGRLTVGYKYNGEFPEDKSKVEVQWWQMVSGLGNQKLISTENSIASTRGVKACVKVTDVKGRNWMFVSGQYN
ncbi:hypothetical protein ABDK00_013990 [Niabella insulamsoli]|uniref:hypothetical protein n=1 Tax=Niabella insulamsoli TaxID=3144874 RepID=UPI0031FDAFE6